MAKISIKREIIATKARRLALLVSGGKKNLSCEKKVVVGVCTFASWGGGVKSPKLGDAAKRSSGNLIITKIYYELFNLKKRVFSYKH